MAEVSISKTVGRYKRGEKIGYGNFGVVYKGIDLQTNRVVAIKTLDLDAVNDEVESVQHEVELLSHLSRAESSNVTKYYGTVLEGSKLWIVMDLCSGGSVRTLLKAGPLEDKFLSVIFREITIAVVAIHREGIIHRDIKAANVLITLVGQVKLCDFGVAANTSLSGQAKRQTIVGTPYWMAPEVIAEGRSYTNKADIWSMGITFYEITTGNPPYSNHEAMRALMLITNSRPPRLEGPKYTPLLKDLVALCLDEDTDARPGAEEVLKHKFLKAYAKSPTSILKALVDRYIAWKNKHKDYRDSLLMFNPHQDNDDVEGVTPSTNDEDGDSVWDFNIEDTASTAKLEPGTEDLSDAPDSLRQLFGVAKKRDSDIPAPPREHMQRSITESVPELSHEASFVPSLGLGPIVRTTNPDNLHVDESNSPILQPVRIQNPHSNSFSLAQPQSPLSAIPSSGFSFPPTKAQNSLEKSTKAATATSISRGRSTTVTVTGGFFPGYRSRNGSDAVHPDTEPALPGNKFLPETPTEPHTSTPNSASQTPLSTLAPNFSHSYSEEPLISPKLASENGSPSPKKSINRRRSSTGKPRVALPKLQMPPRNTFKLLPLMSAPAGQARYHISTLSEDTTASSNSQNSTILSNNSIASNNLSAGSDLGSATLSIRKNFDWPGDFPPMPKFDTAVFLDTSSDELVFDSLLDLMSSFKAAVASLANQFEDS